MQLFKAMLVALALATSLGCENPSPAKDLIQQKANQPEPAQPKTRFNLDTQHIDKTLSQFTESGDLIALSALIYIGGEERFVGAYGMADRENNQAMARDTIVQIYSMTKPVTGVALMTLYEQGKFKLNEPLAKYLPEFNKLTVFAGVDESGNASYETLKRPPTIYDVMRHTAGFVSTHAGENPVVEINRQADPGNLNNNLKQFSELLASVPLLFQPGTRWLYGPSVDVQAALVEKLSGMAFDDYVKQRIFVPLKMENTQWVVNKQQVEKLAAMYTRNEDGTFKRVEDDIAYNYFIKDWPMKAGGWGLTSTLDDYMRFARMLVNAGELEGARILKPETVKLMATDALPSTVGDRSWLSSKGQVGFGIDFAVRVAEPTSPKEASGETGEFFWDGAANTMFWVDPVNKLSAVLFTQYRPFGGVPIHKAFRDAVYLHDESASSLNKPAPAGQKK